MNDPENNTFTISYYLVVFLDALGQSNALETVEMLPASSEELATLQEYVKNTVIRVRRIREGFRRLFEIMDTPTSVLDTLPPAEKRRAAALRKATILFTSFSDSNVIAVPLRKDDQHCETMNGIRSSLLATGGVFVTALAEGYALRGGLDVGLGFEIAPNEIYGAALARAYRFECRDADYPRIVVGSELPAYFDLVSKQQGASPEARLAAVRASSSQGLLFVDDDGRLAVDYLGAEFRSTLGPRASEFRDLIVRRAYAFVCEQADYWTNRGDTKLGPRYARLRSYFDSRLGLWGISTQRDTGSAC